MFKWFSRARAWYGAQPAPIFEAVTLGLALLVGLLVMPALIFLAGTYALGAYANGGVFALYGDFFRGLLLPYPSYWMVVVGPFVLLTLFRVFRALLRKI